MTNSAPQNLKARKFLFAVLLLVIMAAIIWTVLQNRPWTVPEQAKQLQNPSDKLRRSSCSPFVRFIMISVRRVTAIRGKGDGHDASLYDPAPTNFTDAKRLGAVTDGELFYKLTEGRKPMPSFKKRLTEDQRWRLILLLRSFAEPSAAGPAATSSPTH